MLKMTLNFEETLSSHDSIVWKVAISDEMESLISNKTLKLVDLPLGCKTIGCKWVLRKKLIPNRSIDKYKVRLVAKGFKQPEGLEFFLFFFSGNKNYIYKTFNGYNCNFLFANSSNRCKNFFL